jgi:hypothetical protein
MSDELLRARDAVIDEQSFIAFLRELAADWTDERAKETITPSSPYGPGANGWENGTIGQYLDAAAEWAEASTKGLEFYDPPSNAWRRCADILYCGKIYE